MRNSSFLFGACFLAIFSAHIAQANFLPLNNLHRFDNPTQVNQVDEATFNAVMAKVASVYAPIVQSHGGILDIKGDWQDATVNAYADRDGTTWKVRMFGGLARRPEVSPDGFVLVVCHELGHHLAGFPFYSDSTDWAASVEGESDYFATQTCARVLWRGETKTNAYFRYLIDPETRFACSWKWRRTEDQDLCYRTTFASISLATLLSRLGGRPADPSLAARDNNIVRRTDESHPDAQCRLDTMMNGALCDAPFNPGYIPGVDSSLLPNKEPGMAERDAMRYSCRQERGDPRQQPRYGARPLCWFKPNS